MCYNLSSDLKTRESETVMVMEMQKTISVEAYESLMLQPEYADRSFELVDGEMIEMPKPNGEHGEILGDLTVTLGVYIRQNKLGRITSGDTAFVVKRSPDGRDSIRGLDFAFISFDKSPGPLPKFCIPFAPDLAVEVLSPGNRMMDIDRKVEQLLEAGVSLGWIVNPELRKVKSYSATGEFTYRENDTLSGGDVLPGFEIRVGDIFPS